MIKLVVVFTDIISFKSIFFSMFISNHFIVSSFFYIPFPYSQIPAIDIDIPSYLSALRSWLGIPCGC